MEKSHYFPNTGYEEMVGIFLIPTIVILAFGGISLRFEKFSSPRSGSVSVLARRFAFGWTVGLAIALWL